jgi:hypothetical protein
MMNKLQWGYIRKSPDWNIPLCINMSMMSPTEIFAQKPYASDSPVPLPRFGRNGKNEVLEAERLQVIREKLDHDGK